MGDTSSHGGQEPPFLALAPFAGALVAGGYATGFIVSNYHLSRLVVLDYSLLEGRYFAAALLFALLGGLPLAAGALAGTLLFPRNGAKRIPRLLLAAATVVGTGVLWRLILSPMLVTDPLPAHSLTIAPPEEPRLVHFLALAVGLGVVGGVLYSLLGKERSTFHLFGKALVLAVSFAIYVILTAFFADDIYPFIQPNYGGGALWAARLTLKDGRLPGYVPFGDTSPVEDSTSMRTAIAYLDSERIAFLTCIGSSGHGTLEPTVVPRDAVTRIVLDHEVVAIPQHNVTWYACGVISGSPN